MNDKLGTLCTALVLLAASACSGLDDVATAEGDAHDIEASASDEVRAVARIDYPDGRSVSFLEVEPGLLVVDERGRIGSEPLYDSRALDSMSMIELYESLSGERAPAALVEAAGREAASGGNAPRERTADTITAPKSDMPQTRSGDLGVSARGLSNGLDTEAFKEEYCNNNAEAFNWIGVTGDGSVTRSDVYMYSTAVLATRGTVHWVVKIKPWYSWRTVKNLDIPEGWYERVNGGHSSIDRDVRTSVSEADGDRYDMCSRFYR